MSGRGEDESLLSAPLVDAVLDARDNKESEESDERVTVDIGPRRARVPADTGFAANESLVSDASSTTLSQKGKWYILSSPPAMLNKSPSLFSISLFYRWGEKASSLTVSSSLYSTKERVRSSFSLPLDHSMMYDCFPSVISIQR